MQTKRSNICMQYFSFSFDRFPMWMHSECLFIKTVFVLLMWVTLTAAKLPSEFEMLSTFIVLCFFLLIKAKVGLIKIIGFQEIVLCTFH